MGQISAKIVLTGGPCAGKTTALSKIEQELTDRGYRVFVVGESATELIKGGIRPFGLQAISMIDFQRLILKYQLEKEKLYEQAIAMLPDQEKCVLLYDRGLMDNKAYITDQEFHCLVKEEKLEELDMMDNYDMVIHMVTAADGCPEYYTLENNQARSEGIEEAIRLDRRLVHAWSGHNRLVLIDNSTDFQEKMNRVLENIYQLLHYPYSLRYQRKYIVNLQNMHFPWNNQEDVTEIDIEQSYLVEEKEDYEKRLRKRTFQDEATYYLTVQKKSMDGFSKIVMDKKITEKEYLKLLEGNIEGTLKKKRYTFIYQKQYFKLDIIDGEDYGILEVNPISKNAKVSLPQEFDIEREVTNDENFDNRKIASRKKQNKQKKKNIL